MTTPQAPVSIPPPPTLSREPRPAVERALSHCSPAVGPLLEEYLQAHEAERAAAKGVDAHRQAHPTHLACQLHDVWSAADEEVHRAGRVVLIALEGLVASAQEALDRQAVA